MERRKLGFCRQWFVGGFGVLFLQRGGVAALIDVSVRFNFAIHCSVCSVLMDLIMMAVQIVVVMAVAHRNKFFGNWLGLKWNVVEFGGGMCQDFWIAGRFDGCCDMAVFLFWKLRWVWSFEEWKLPVTVFIVLTVGSPSPCFSTMMVSVIAVLVTTGSVEDVPATKMDKLKVLKYTILKIWNN